MQVFLKEFVRILKRCQDSSLMIIVQAAHRISRPRDRGKPLLFGPPRILEWRPCFEPSAWTQIGIFRGEQIVIFFGARQIIG